MNEYEKLVEQRKELDEKIRSLESTHNDKVINNMVGKYYTHGDEYMRVIGKSGSREIKYNSIDMDNGDLFMCISFENLTYTKFWTEITSDEYYEVLTNAMLKLQKEYDTRK